MLLITLPLFSYVVIEKNTQPEHPSSVCSSPDALHHSMTEDMGRIEWGAVGGTG